MHGQYSVKVTSKYDCGCVTEFTGSLESVIYEVVRDLLVDGRVVLVELAVDDDDSTFDEEYDARITIVLRHSPHDGTTAGAVAKRLHKLPEFKGLRFSSYETLAEDELI